MKPRQKCSTKSCVKKASSDTKHKFWGMISKADFNSPFAAGFWCFKFSSSLIYYGSQTLQSRPSAFCHFCPGCWNTRYCSDLHHLLCHLQPQPYITILHFDIFHNALKLFQKTYKKKQMTTHLEESFSTSPSG